MDINIEEKQEENINSLLLNSSSNLNATFNLCAQTTTNASTGTFYNPGGPSINIVSKDENISILIYDLLGRKLIKAQSLKINISDFPSGIYMINVLNESKQIIHKEKVVKN